jgi:hypothetical protein
MKGCTMSQQKKITPPNMIVGVFSTLRNAEAAVQELESIGLNSQEITVISSNDVVKDHFQQYQPEVDPDDWRGAAMLGGATGAVLAGLTSVAALVTGAGIPIIVAGGLASFITGGVVGGLAGVMAERGFETEAADYYELAVADGKTLVAVDLTTRSDVESKRVNIETILDETGSEAVELTKNPDFSSK